MKQVMVTIGLALALLLGALLASGVLFTGAVVHNSGSAMSDTAHR
ncbi:MAG: hypothetical protein NTV43_15845 [Methylococcales bacterium]|nr:hypothetical protein [Methylococcales bacterium]